MEKKVSALSFFANHLHYLISMEKQLIKLYLKIEKTCYTPELSKALSKNETGAEKHLQRLELIKKSVEDQKMDKKPLEESIKLNLKPTEISQDLLIISKVLTLQNTKLSCYEFLYPIATALEMQNEAALLEQSITDNRNTNTWLRQIIQNVIVPAIKP